MEVGDETRNQDKNSAISLAMHRLRRRSELSSGSSEASDEASEVGHRTGDDSVHDSDFSDGESSYFHKKSIFHPGRNAWRVERAERASFLVDADRYFRAFVECCLNAKKSILILGWDTDSRTELPFGDGTITLGHLLELVLDNNPELEIRILSWDYAFIYLFEREALSSVKFSSISTASNGRLKFVMDDHHPALASHHQKIVVVDDEVGFSGGLDLTQRRWDTSEHRGNDTRRVDPGGHVYGPFHDVQICVDGNAARALGEIVRERWRLATDETLALPPMNEAKVTSWPKSVSIDMTAVDVAIARTLPYGYSTSAAGEPSKPVCEVERLFLDSIRSAKRYVYIENQYFTSLPLARAIAKRLQEEDGPEFVLVLPRDQTGWIEESTMGVLRSRALRTVEEADIHGRFRCFYPVVPGLGEQGYVKIHSKVMVIDDEFVRIGSANLNNRSMGFDTECDLAIESSGRPGITVAIENLRTSLMAEHLGVEKIEIRARLAERGSLVECVDSFLKSCEERTLIPMRPQHPEWVDKISPPREWIDPSSPAGIRRWFQRRIRRNRRVLLATLLLAVMFSSSLLWSFVAESWEWVRSWDADRIAGVLSVIRGSSMSVPLILGGFVVGSLIFIPISAMILGVALTFPLIQAIPLALAGALLSAINLYWIGRYWAWTKSSFLSRPLVKKLSERMTRGGVLAITAVRLTPIAPFAIVGVVAGGLRLRLRDYVLGTAFGLLPGISALALLSHGATETASRRDWTGLFWVAIALLVFSFLLPRLSRRVRPNEPQESR